MQASEVGNNSAHFLLWEAHAPLLITTQQKTSEQTYILGGYWKMRWRRSPAIFIISIVFFYTQYATGIDM